MTAAPDYLVDGLVTSLKNKYLTPQSQNTFDDDDIVSLLDEEMRACIVPLVSSVYEEYWVENYDQAVTGAASYTVPQRTAAAVLRDIVFVDTQGNEIDMQQLSPVQIKSTFPFGFQLPLYTFGYYLQNDKVFLYPQQAQNATQYTLRMKFIRRPNNLTLSSNCGQVQSFSSITNIVTLGSLDSTWTTSTTFDIIQNFPQFSAIDEDVAITNINTSTNQITLSSIPSGLAVGMWFCPTLMSCIPQIPYEAFSALVWRGVLTLAESLGDSQGAQLGEKRFQDAKISLLQLMTPRVQGGTKKVVNRNSPYNWGTMGTPFLR